MNEVLKKPVDFNFFSNVFPFRTANQAGFQKQWHLDNEASQFDCSTRRINITQRDFEKWSLVQEVEEVVLKIYLRKILLYFGAERFIPFKWLSS